MDVGVYYCTALLNVMPLTQQIDSHIIAVTEKSVREQSGTQGGGDVDFDV